MDALCHAIEAYTSTQASALSDMAAEKAMELIARSIETAVSKGTDIKAREDMLTGSFLGGVALANAGVGAVHSLSYPLGGSYRIPHGVANGLLLPYVMDYNASECEVKYAEVARIFGSRGDEKASDAAALIRHLAEKINVPLRLSELEIPKDDFPEMADAAMKVSRPLENNPREVLKEDAVQIYMKAF